MKLKIVTNISSLKLQIYFWKKYIYIYILYWTFEIAHLKLKLHFHGKEMEAAFGDKPCRKISYVENPSQSSLRIRS